MTMKMVAIFLALLMIISTTKTNANSVAFEFPRNPSSSCPVRTLDQRPSTKPLPNNAAGVHDALVNWKETATAHEITLDDIPGLNKEDVKIEVVEESSRMLRISRDQRAEEQVEAGHKWHTAERTNIGKFWSQFRLPENADLDQIKAHLQDGVLKVTVPKFAADDHNQKRKPKIINIAHLHTTSSASSSNSDQVA